MGLRLNTIFKRLFLPVFIVMLMQVILYIVIFYSGGIIQQAEDNAVKVLREKVINRQTYLQSEMLTRWANLDEGVDMLLGDVRATLAREGKSAQDIAGDTALNAAILQDLSADLIYMLRKNISTGAFVVLDGPAVAGETGTRAGVYIRDLDPVSSYSGDYEDLQFLRGLPGLSKQLGISLDSFWEASFKFAGDGSERERFFFEPLDAAKNAPGAIENSADYGYWSMPFSVSERDMPVITYSRPLVLDGVVIGVIGADITMSYLQSFLPYTDLSVDGGGVYFLGMTTGDGVFHRIAQTGPVFKSHFGGASSITGGGAGRSGTISVEAPDGMDFYAAPEYFRLYNPNTPFESQQWVLIGMMRSDDIHAHANNIRNMVYVSTIASLLLGSFGIFIASETISRPIRRLATKLKKADPNKQIVLDKLNINEIDLLTVSIEDLSKAVADSASKLTRIIEMLNLPVGVYEKNLSNNQVFCSRKWFEYTMGEVGVADQYITSDEFDACMAELEVYRADPAQDIFMLPRGEDNMWLRLDQSRHDGLILGALSDVTKDTKEKLRIEYERDYDVLTDLYNRRAFEINSEELFREPDALKTSALIMWDLDNLKYVNDTYGHTAGDEYICAFADVLRKFDPAHSLIARRSGDEFYTFLYGYDDSAAIDEQIRLTWEALQRSSWKLPDGGNMRIRVSAGVAWYPKDAQTMDNLIHYADFAMYNVKHTSKGRIKEFNMQTYMQNSVLISGTEAINQLIEQRLLHYAMQPIIDAHTAEIFGYEMLLRSDMKELPGVSDVLRLASAQSKLDAIEELTFFMGMKTFKNYVESGEITRGTKVFLNSIGGQIMPEDLEMRFERAFAEFLGDLVVEITETQYTTYEGILQKVNRVRGWGARLALDDFGSGYNTETSLIRFSPDIVKVDISIVAGIDLEVDQQSLFRNLVSYARPRGIKVLAEGVEREAELRTLMELGVDYVQGYLFARPASQPAPLNEAAIKALQELIAEQGQG